MNAASIRSMLEEQARPSQVEHSQRFFKTGPGEYAEGDIFWGIPTPVTRAVVRQGKDLPLAEVERLLEDPIHEVRACALCILVEQFRKAAPGRKGAVPARQQAIIDLYLRRTDRINNWDLVDISCGILGEWLADKDRAILYRLADSPNMWEQRIAVVATMPLIKRGDFTDILALGEKLLSHPHDLMHKALGWMLREVGKKDKATLEAFLNRHIAALPRTTLRYAIERFPAPERQVWLKK